MTDGWPREVERTADGSGVVYRLPVRTLGVWRWIGLLPVGFGLLFMSGPLKIAVRTAADWPGPSFSWMDLLPTLFSLPFILGGLVPIAIGFFLLFGRCRVECRGRQLKVVESAGPFWWTRRLAGERIQKFEVSGGSAVPATAVTAPSNPGAVAGFAALSAFSGAPKPSLVVIGYPRPWLLAMARELSALTNPLPGINPGAAVEVNEQPLVSRLQHAADQPQPDVDSPPPDCRIKLTQLADGIAIEVPPLGLRKGSYGLVFFAALWCGFVAFATVLVISKTKGPPPLLLLPFWLVGIFLATLSLHLGRRTFRILVKADGVHVTQTGILGTKQRHCPASDLTDIRVGPSGVEVNDRPIIELQLHPRTGRKIGLLGGRDVQELHWIATRLRRATGIAAPPPGPRAPLPG